MTVKKYIYSIFLLEFIDSNIFILFYFISNSIICRSLFFFISIFIYFFFKIIDFFKNYISFFMFDFCFSQSPDISPISLKYVFFFLSNCILSMLGKSLTFYLRLFPPKIYFSSIRFFIGVLNSTFFINWI